MITHNNSSNFDSEFFRNQIEILSGGYFPEFDQKDRAKIENGFDYEKVLQTSFYQDRFDRNEVENKTTESFNNSFVKPNTISDFQIVPQVNKSVHLFNVGAIRKDIPILNEKIDGKNF